LTTVLNGQFAKNTHKGTGVVHESPNCALQKKD